MVNTLKLLYKISACFALLIGCYVQSFAATQSSYTTKTTPVTSDKALITDSADGNKTKQATIGSLPISTATQSALDGKAGVSCFANAAAFNACFPLDWPTGFDVTANYTVTGAWDFSGATVIGISGGAMTWPASDSAYYAARNGAWTSLSGVFASALGSDDNYVTDAEKVKLGNLSGINTGDQDLSGFLSKTNTTAYTPSGDYNPATKKYVDDSITAGGGYTDEQAQDAVGGMFSGNTETGITVTYDDATGKVNFSVATQFDGTQNTTGSAAKLTTPRTIGGVSFDGSENINLPGVNAVGNQNTTGSAATLTTARTIGGTSFNGSANIDISYANLINKPTIPTVSDTVYDATSWNGDTDAPSKNAVRDKIESIAGGSMTYPGAGVPKSTGTSWDTSYTVGTGASNLVQLDSSSRLPAVSGALLTDTFTGTLISGQTTHKAAIQAIATELDNAVDITAGTGITISSGSVSVTANTYQAYDADWLGITANGASLVSAADYAAMRALLDLETGTDFYSMSAADTVFQKATGPVYPVSASTSTATGNINIDGVSADHYYFNNGSSTATYTPVITSPPASGKERAIILTVGGGSGVITMTWTNVSFIGTAGAATTTPSKYSHYGCFIPSSGNAKCKIIAEASDN